MNYKFINTDYLNSVTGGDPDITREIIEMFKIQVEEIHAEMGERIAKKDYQYLGQLAHKAKSSVAIMGINELAIMLKTFELHAKEGFGSELYDSYIFRFKSETASAIAELDDFVSNMK